MVDVLGRLVVLNEENHSGLKLLLDDGSFKWFDAKPSLIEAACVGLNAPVKVGDTVKLKMVGNTKEFINIMRIDQEALNAVKEHSDTTVKLLNGDGSVAYTTELLKGFSQSDLIIRQVAAKCATEIACSLKLNQAEWVSWAGHVNKWIKGSDV